MQESNLIQFPEYEALSSVQMLNKFVDGLLELSDKLKNNHIQLSEVQRMLKQQELNDNFCSIKEVAEALNCTPKSAMNELRKRNVEIITSSKTYMVQRDNFLNAFRG